MKKNILFVGISVILLILLGIGFSYSMWNMSTSQETSNVIASSECFDISITSQENNISLQNAYPISNEKGKKLTPFTFTVKNTCETAVKYSINLESLIGSTLSSEFLDVMLNNGEIKRLNSYNSVNKVNSSSVESRELETGILGNKESRNYSLRLWIDYDTTMEDLNNETKALKSKVIVIGTPIDYIGQTVFNFDYTGSEQTFTVPVSGTYKLETWGAQGGSAGSVNNLFDANDGGGNGGYATGFVFLAKDTTIYNYVGSTDFKNCTTFNDGYYCTGGYNGGGNSQDWHGEKWGVGGGATHIAFTSGLLKDLATVKDEILIVSGGGGGGYHAEIGGSGGGYLGVNGSLRDDFVSAQGGSQSSAGSGYKVGSFGQGGDCRQSENINCSGGGAGFYGGAGSYGINGAGGSGYIGNSLLKDKVMYCYNCEESSEESTKTISTTCNEETPTSYCAKKGNGYARITLVSIEE